MRVGVIDGRHGGFPVILENENVPEALVIFQVQHAVAVSPEHVFHGALWQSRQRRRMIRRLHDHFMSADSVHLVEEAFPFAVQIAFDAQRWEFVRYHSDTPARSVGPAAVPAIYQNLSRRLDFVPPAKGTSLRLLGDNALP